jgi:cytochrome c peroxidase
VVDCEPGAGRRPGKILFWDEQLSSDNTVACGTCHAFRVGGADPRPAMLPGPDGLPGTADDLPGHPGADGVLGSADDQPVVHPGADGLFDTGDEVRGSMGVVRRDAVGEPVDDPVFGFGPQVTPRATPNFFSAILAPDVLWDGRAEGQFVDPEDGTTVLIASEGGLESQATLPLFNPVEMAKEGRTPAELAAKIAASVPWLQNVDHPPDVAARLASDPSYPELFQDAFGDPAVTTARVAFAIATYERTLVPDQTPFDLGTLTPAQQNGRSAFLSSECDNCHEPGPGPGHNFSDSSFRFLGLRPADEDLGRQEITGGGSCQAGAFKVPSLRNVGLKPHYMHTGDFETLAEVLAFYATSPTLPSCEDEIPINLGADMLDVMDFLQNGLTDPRVANETFPFDSPTMLPEPSHAWMQSTGLLALIALRRPLVRRLRTQRLSTR